jgi:hypothetical protein
MSYEIALTATTPEGIDFNRRFICPGTCVTYRYRYVARNDGAPYNA